MRFTRIADGETTAPVDESRVRALVDAKPESEQ